MPAPCIYAGICFESIARTATSFLCALRVSVYAGCICGEREKRIGERGIEVSSVATGRLICTAVSEHNEKGRGGGKREMSVVCLRMNGNVGGKGT